MPARGTPKPTLILGLTLTDITYLAPPTAKRLSLYLANWTRFYESRYFINTYFIWAQKNYIVTGPDHITSKEMILKCFSCLATWYKSSNQCELIETASKIIEIGAKLSVGWQIESDEVKCLSKISESLTTSCYPVHLQTIEALICTSWSRCYLYQVDWLSFSFNLVASSPIGNGK